MLTYKIYNHLEGIGYTYSKKKFGCIDTRKFTIGYVYL